MTNLLASFLAAIVLHVFVFLSVLSIDGPRITFAVLRTYWWVWVLSVSGFTVCFLIT